MSPSQRGKSSLTVLEYGSFGAGGLTLSGCARLPDHGRECDERRARVPARRYSTRARLDVLLRCLGSIPQRGGAVLISAAPHGSRRAGPAGLSRSGGTEPAAVTGAVLPCGARCCRTGVRPPKLHVQMCVCVCERGVIFLSHMIPGIKTNSFFFPGPALSPPNTPNLLDYI